MVSAIDATKPADGENASKADLRANLATTKSEIGELQALTGQDTPSDVVRVRPHIQFIEEYANIRDFGATANGTVTPVSTIFTDLSDAQAYFGNHVTSLSDGVDWAAIQKLISEERHILVPANADARVEKSLIIPSNVSSLTLKGMSSVTSRIQNISTGFSGTQPLIFQEDGYVDRDLVARDKDGATTSVSTLATQCKVLISSIYLRASHTESSGVVYLRNAGIGSNFYDIYFNLATRGLVLENAFSCSVVGVRFNAAYGTVFSGDFTKSNSDMGLYTPGHTEVLGCDFAGLGTGLQFTGTGGGAVKACRFEVNGTGIRLGHESLSFEPALSIFPGNQRGLDRAVLSGNSFERNMIAANFGSGMANVEFSNFGIDGSPAGPQFLPGSHYGLIVSTTGAKTRIERGRVFGQYSSGTVKFEKPYRGAFNDVDVSNGVSGKPAILGLGNLVGQSGSLEDHVRSHTTLSGARLSIDSQALNLGRTQYRYNSDPVFCKKSGGAETPADASTTIDVVWVDPPTANQVSLTGVVTAVADGSSTLAAGTYEYTTTIITEFGETGIGSPATATGTAAAGERLDVFFFGSSRVVTARRVYRRAPGEDWQGYFEFPNAGKFEDVGQAFSGLGGPPENTVQPASPIEDDADYHITLGVPSFDMGGVSISNKTTSGFTLTWENAAPTGSEVIPWEIFRL